MEQIMTALEMRKIDEYTIEKIGIPSMVLVENAARSVADYIQMNFPKKLKIIIFCGNGNNGADSICLARILTGLNDEDGKSKYDVNLYVVSKEGKKSVECKSELEIAIKFGVKIVGSYNLSSYDLVIDGIFGIGLNRDIEGVYEKCILDINNSNIEVLSLDIPSGIHGTKGTVMGCAIKAKTTISFGYKKTGHLLGQGPDYTGTLLCKDIGLYQGEEIWEYYNTYSFGEKELPQIASRQVTGNKGTFGKVLLLAGGIEYSGAAILSCMAAYRTGVGMVRVITHKNNKTDILMSCPGAIVLDYDDEYDKDTLLESFRWCDVLAMGPGIGRDLLTVDIYQTLLEYCERDTKKPVIIDADGINIISRDMTLLERLIKSETVVFTPHIMELSRLLNQQVKVVKEDLVILAKEFTRKWNAILVCKDAKTLAIDGDKEKVYINQSGNDGMATAGSGDVLTGMIAALLCKETNNPYYAIISAVQMHGMAGDIAYKKYKSGLIASDIISAIHEVM